MRSLELTPPTSTAATPSTRSEAAILSSRRDAAFEADSFPQEWTTGWDAVLGDTSSSASRPQQQRALYHALPIAALAYAHALRSLVTIDVSTSAARLVRGSQLLQAAYRKSDAEHAQSLAAATGLPLAVARRLTRGSRDDAPTHFERRDRRQILCRARAHWTVVAQCVAADDAAAPLAAPGRVAATKTLCFADAYDDDAAFRRARGALSATVKRELAACDAQRGALQREFKASRVQPPPPPPPSLMSKLCGRGRRAAAATTAATATTRTEEEGEEDAGEGGDDFVDDAAWTFAGALCRPRHVVSTIVMLRKAALQLEAPNLALPEQCAPLRSWCHLVGTSIEGDGVDYGQLMRGAPFWNADGAVRRSSSSWQHGHPRRTAHHAVPVADVLSLGHAVDELVEHCARHFACTELWRALVACVVLAQNVAGALHSGVRSWAAVLRPAEEGGSAEPAAQTRCTSHLDRLNRRMAFCERLLRRSSEALAISTLERELANDLFEMLVGAQSNGALVQAVLRYPLYFSGYSGGLLHSVMALMIKAFKINAHVRAALGEEVPRPAECEQVAKQMMLAAIERSVQMELVQIKTLAASDYEKQRGEAVKASSGVESGIPLPWHVPASVLADATTTRRGARSSDGPRLAAGGGTKTAHGGVHAHTARFTESAFFDDDDPELAFAAEAALEVALGASAAAEGYITDAQLAMDYALQPLRGSLRLAVLGVRLAVQDTATAYGPLLAVARIGNSSWMLPEVHLLDSDEHDEELCGHWTPIKKQAESTSATAFPGGVRYAPTQTAPLQEGDADVLCEATDRLEIAESVDARRRGVRIEIRRGAGAGAELGSCIIPTIELLQQRPTRGHWALEFPVASPPPADALGLVGAEALHAALLQPACHSVLLQFHFTPFQRVVIDLHVPTCSSRGMEEEEGVSLFAAISKMPAVKWSEYSSQPLCATLTDVMFAALPREEQKEREQPILDEDYVAIFPVASSYAYPNGVEASMDEISFASLVGLGVRGGCAWPADNGAHPLLDPKTETWRAEWRTRPTPVECGLYEIRCFRRKAGRTLQMYELIARSSPFEVWNELPPVDFPRALREQRNKLKLYSSIFGMSRDSIARDEELLRSIAGRTRSKEQREPRFDMRDTLHPIEFLAGAGRMWNSSAPDESSALCAPGHPLELSACGDAGSGAALTWLYFHCDAPMFVHDVIVGSSDPLKVTFEVSSSLGKGVDHEGWCGTKIHAAELPFNHVMPVCSSSKTKFLVNRTARYFRVGVRGEDDICIASAEFRTLLHEYVGSIKRRACGGMIKSALASVTDFVKKRYDDSVKPRRSIESVGEIAICTFVSTLNAMRREEPALFDEADHVSFAELLPFWVMEAFAEKSEEFREALANNQLYIKEDCEAEITGKWLDTIQRSHFEDGLTPQPSSAVQAYANWISVSAYEFCILPGANTIEHMEFFANTIPCGLLKLALQETAAFGHRAIEEALVGSGKGALASSTVRVRLCCTCLNDLNELVPQLDRSVSAMLEKAPETVRSGCISDDSTHDLKTLSVQFHVCEGLDLRTPNASEKACDPYVNVRLVGATGQRTRFPLRPPSNSDVLQEKTDACRNSTSPVWAHLPSSLLNLNGAPGILMNPVLISVLDGSKVEGDEPGMIGRVTVPVDEMMSEELWSELATLRMIRDSRRRLLLGQVSVEEHARKVELVQSRSGVSPTTLEGTGKDTVDDGDLANDFDVPVDDDSEEEDASRSAGIWDATRILQEYFEEGTLTRAEFNAIAIKVQRLHEQLEPFEANTLSVVVLDSVNVPRMNQGAEKQANLFCKLSIKFCDGSSLPRASRLASQVTSATTARVPHWCEPFTWEVCDKVHGMPGKALMLEIELTSQASSSWSGNSVVGRVRIPLNDERLAHGKTCVFSLLAERPERGDASHPTFNLTKGVGRKEDCKPTPITREGTKLLNAVNTEDYASAKKILADGGCSEYDRVVAAEAAVAHGHPEFEGIQFGCTFDLAVCWTAVPPRSGDQAEKTTWKLYEDDPSITTFGLAKRGMISLHHTYDLRAKASYTLDTVGKYLGDLAHRERQRLAAKLVTHICSNIDAQLPRAMFGVDTWPGSQSAHGGGNLNLFASDWSVGAEAKLDARSADLMRTTQVYLRLLCTSVNHGSSNGIILALWKELCSFARRKLRKAHLRIVVHQVAIQKTDAAAAPQRRGGNTRVTSQWSISEQDGCILELTFEKLFQLFRRYAPGHDQQLWTASEKLFHSLQLWKVSTQDLKELVCTMLAVDVGADGTDCHNQEGELVVDSTERSLSLHFDVKDPLAILWLRAQSPDAGGDGGNDVLAAWVRRAEVIEDHVCFDVRHPSEAFPALAKRIAHQIAELKARVHH